MKYLKLKPEMYPVYFHFLFGKWDEKRANKLLKAQPGAFTMPEGPCTKGLAFDSDCHQVIWRRKLPKDAASQSKLVHELVHAVHNAGRFIGEANMENDEFHAYLVQWLYLEVVTWASSQ